MNFGSTFIYQKLIEKCIGKVQRSKMKMEILKKVLMFFLTQFTPKFYLNTISPVNKTNLRQ